MSGISIIIKTKHNNIVSHTDTSEKRKNISGADVIERHLRYRLMGK